MRSNKNICKCPHFLFYYDALPPNFRSSPCLAYVIKIKSRAIDKIGTILVLNRNKIVGKTDLKFIDWFKGNFEAKSRKDFRDFEKDEKIKR